MKISSTAHRLTEWAGHSMIHSGTYSCNIECKFCCSIEVVIGATHLRVVSVKVYIILNSNYLLFCRWPEQCRPHARIEYLAEACNHIEMQPRVTNGLKPSVNGPKEIQDISAISLHLCIWCGGWEIWWAKDISFRHVGFSDSTFETHRVFKHLESHKCANDLWCLPACVKWENN